MPAGMNLAPVRVERAHRGVRLGSLSLRISCRLSSTMLNQREGKSCG